MRTSLTVILALLTLFVISGCSTATPKEVAENSVKYLKEKKFDKYVDLVYFEEEVNGNKDLLKDKKESMRDLIQSKYNMSVQENGTIKNYSFIDEEVKDSTAFVSLQIDYTSGKSDTQKVKLRKIPSGEWRIDFNTK